MDDVDRSSDQGATTAKPRRWAQRYGERHRWRRLADFPDGIAPPRKVRVYLRAGGYLLNWWDPGLGKNVSERVQGDLLSALARARQVDDKLVAVRTAGAGKAARVGHADLVARFVADLGCRADAGEVDPRTARRYHDALRHYLAFAGQPAVLKAYPAAAAADRPFRLAFAAFLAARAVTGNGRAAGPGRPMRSAAYVLDTARAMFAWAADPDRGGLLPEGFRNPFLGAAGKAPVLKGDPLAAPDVTMAMAADFVRACDAFQLRLFVPMILFGLRAAEPCGLFAEHLSDDWLAVSCDIDLELATKGRRDKRCPLLPALRPFWDLLRGGLRRGLLYERRAAAAGPEQTPLLGSSRQDLVAEYRRRCAGAAADTAVARRRLRDAVLRDAGALRYDHIQAEFSRLAKRLGWPPAATAKDFRHLFATASADAGLPDGYRRYLLGHAPGREAAVAYTHLADLPARFADAVHKSWEPVVAAITERTAALAAVASSAAASGR